MKRSQFVFRVCALIALVTGLVSIGQAQNREKFGISAKAGGVNSVSGRVMVKREGQAQQLLSSRDDLAPGDVVTTSVDSQAEVLLNPGSYLRAGENTEFMLVTTSLDNLVVKLIRGSAIIEATGPDDAGMRIIVATDQKRMAIVRSGIYRINAQAGKTELIVRKGQVRLGPGAADLVKGGKRITFSGNTEQVEKISKQDQDDFDSWSKERGQALARANQKLSARTVSQQLFGYRWNDWAFSAANRYGLWTWSPFASCYTFMPFFYGWSSPYGHYYGSYYNRYPYSYDPGNGRSGSGDTIVGTPRQPPQSGSGSGTFGGSSGGSGGSRGSSEGPSYPMPSNRPAPSEAGPRRDPDAGRARPNDN